MNDRYHGDEPIIEAERERFEQGRREAMADDALPPLPPYDLKMVLDAEREFVGYQTDLNMGRSINYEKVAIGLLVDHGDTIRRALALYRLSFHQ